MKINLFYPGKNRPYLDKSHIERNAWNLYVINDLTMYPGKMYKLRCGFKAELPEKVAMHLYSTLGGGYSHHEYAVSHNGQTDVCVYFTPVKDLMLKKGDKVGVMSFSLTEDAGFFTRLAFWAKGVKLIWTKTV